MPTKILGCRKTFTQDIIGKKYGRLTAIRFVDIWVFPKGTVGARWIFKCDCGIEKLFFRRNVLAGNTMSCGCYAKEFHNGGHNKTHGESKTHFYKLYYSIKTRCENSKWTAFSDYGGRGIKCEWKSYEEFKKDMQSTYRVGLSIERKNNNGNYSKSNCKWATVMEQQSNRRNTVVLEMDGVSKPLTEWSRQYSMPFSTLRQRIASGWSVKDALTKPSLKRKSETVCHIPQTMPDT